MRTRPEQGWCRHCKKWLYSSRKAAKAACRRKYPNERIQPYRCPHFDGFHGGHLAPEVIAGEWTRSEFYRAGGVGEVRYKQGTRKPLRRAS